MKLKTFFVAAALLSLPATTFALLSAQEGRNALAEEAAAPVWHGVTDINGFSADYTITYNADKTITVSASDVTASNLPENDFNFHIINPTGEWLKLYDKDGDGVYTGTTTATFEEETVINWEWYIPVAGGGLYQEGNAYTAGSSNEKPVSIKISATSRNITAVSAEIAYTVNAPEGVEYKVYYKAAEGEAVEATASPVKIENLTERTEYTYEVYAVAGELTSRHATVTFTTLSASARDYVYADILQTTFKNAYLNGESEADKRDIAVSLPWSVTYKADGTAVYAIDLSSVENVAGLTPQVWSYGFFALTKNPETGLYEYNFGAKTLDDGTAISHYISYAGGNIDVPSGYTKWGMEKEAPLNITVTAKAENVTFNSAEITYTVTAPAETAYKVYYKAAGGEATEATENPVKLTGLAEKTSYTYEVYATVTEGGKTVESEHATVTFKTTAENAVSYVYSDLFNAEFKNAFKIGEDESMRRSFFVTLPWSVTYKEDGTAVYSVDLSQVEDIVGLNPQIYWNGFKQLSKNAETGNWEYNFGDQELNKEVAISHYFAYNGAVVDSRTTYTEWGMEKEAPAIGEAVSLTLTASKTMVKMNEPVALSAVAKDEAGYYIPVDEVEYTVDANGKSYDLNGDMFKFTGDQKGTVKITANVGSLEASVEITAIASPEANNLIAGKAGVTCNDHITDGSVANVTDNDLNSFLKWYAEDTEEHYLIFDLGKAYHIEAIDLLFEGAYATEFTVTLSNNAPAELGTAAALAAEGDAWEDVVFTPAAAGTQHYFNRDAQEENNTHRFVTLRTTKAFSTDPAWGIKVRDMKVYGTENAPTTGVEEISVEDSNAPVEYFNLSGVRVNNPSAGLYIVRQGSKVSKVIIR